MPTSMGSVTALLAAAEHGDEAARGELYPMVADELRNIARKHMRNERPNQTLQTTILVHDAFLRLVGPDAEPRQFEHRLHFYRTAARVMRRMLIDHARSRQRREEFLQRVDVELSKLEQPSPARKLDYEALDEALQRLASLNPRHGDVIELRYFCGFTIAETAEQLGVTPGMIKKYTRAATAWLHRELTRGETSD